MRVAVGHVGGVRPRYTHDGHGFAMGRGNVYHTVCVRMEGLGRTLTEAPVSSFSDMFAVSFLVIVSYGFFDEDDADCGVDIVGGGGMGGGGGENLLTYTRGACAHGHCAGG